MNGSTRQRLLDDPALLSGMIGQIYDAAADPAHWPRFLARIGELLELRAINFVISHNDPATGFAALPATWGLSDGEISQYESHYAEVDPHRLPTLRHPAGTVGTAELLVPDAEYVRSEYFNDYYARIGLRHGFATSIHNDGGVASVLVCHRGPDRGPADDVDLELLRRLTPHLQRARALSLQLGTLQSQERIGQDVLDRIPVGLIFVDGSGRFLSANARGEEILREEDGLELNQGRLVTGHISDTRALGAIVATACAAGLRQTSSAAMSLCLDRPSGRRHLEVMACPIDHESRLWREGPAAAFLVVSDGAAELTGATHRLRDLFGLTDTEAALTIALVRGATLKEWAAQRDVSIETVRWQLKQVFAKTGTSRQPDLMRLVLLGPALVS